MAAGIDEGFRLLTLGEASAILAVHENTLRRWSDAGLIQYFRVGPRNDRRYLDYEVRRFAESSGYSLKGTLSPYSASET
jgi:DNA-binding transcriptional MerR regulator